MELEAANTLANSRSKRATSRRKATREVILTAAKELVAIHGPHATTVRDITEKSGANVAAVNYYFQSKDELMSLAMSEIVVELNAARSVQLDAARARTDAPLSSEIILRALVEPILTTSRSEDGGSLYLRVVQQIRINQTDSLSRQVFGKGRPVAQKFIAEMERTFPGTDRLELSWRYEFARGAATHLLGNLDPFSRRTESLAYPGELPPTPQETLDQAAVNRAIAIILRGF